MLYLILLLPVALAVCCCVLRPDGGRARSAVLLAVQGAELLLVLLAVCRGAELVCRLLAHVVKAFEMRGGVDLSRVDRAQGVLEPEIQAGRRRDHDENHRREDAD